MKMYVHKQQMITQNSDTTNNMGGDTVSESLKTSTTHCHRIQSDYPLTRNAIIFCFFKDDMQ